MTEQELRAIIIQAKIEENIYWYNRAHFMASKKHETRIRQLMEDNDGQQTE